MKLVRFEHAGRVVSGILSGEQIQLLSGDFYSDYELTGQSVRISEVKLLAPCVPNKAICVGLNYHDHAREMKLELPKTPLIFIKPASSLNHPQAAILYPTISSNVHYEAELAVVIKKQAKRVAVDQAGEYILGYTCANDVTARDIQHNDGQWTRGKSCDTFLPLGPWIETDIDPHQIDIKLYLNDQLKQSSNTCNLIFQVPEILAFVTQSMTLWPGDVILTGTPAGVGPMRPGDIVAVELAGIGRLVNTVAAE